MRRRANGEGSIYKRKDGRWAANVYVTLSDGKRMRKNIIGRVGGGQEAVRHKLEEIKAQERKRIPFASKKWTVEGWLDHWIADIAPRNIRQRTLELYEASVRLYLKPVIGKILLENLTVRKFQETIDCWQTEGMGIRTIHKNMAALSVALSRAMRDELIFRNVARLVELPKYKPKSKIIWTVEQQLSFLTVSKNHNWYVGFLIGLLYGVREGEVLGLPNIYFG